jgi:hypothetical protein
MAYMAFPMSIKVLLAQSYYLIPDKQERSIQSMSLPLDGCERISHNARSLTRFQFAYRILISIPLEVSKGLTGGGSIKSPRGNGSRTKTV